MRSFGRSILVDVLAVAATLSMMKPIAESRVPSEGSKGIARGRLPHEPNEYNTSKPKSASLKRLLRK